MTTRHITTILVAVLLLNSGALCQPPANRSSALAAQSSNPPDQPYVAFIQGNSKRYLPGRLAAMTQSKTKESDLTALAMDNLVNEAIAAVGMKAAGQAVTALVLAGHGTAALGVLGVASGLVLNKLGKIFSHRITLTYLWALPGGHASTELQTNRPRFELFYGDLVGVDADEYEPAIVKLVPTKNNWRLLGATKGKVDAFKSSWEMYSSFLEERVPLRLNRLGRGLVQVEMEQGLQPGEYGIVLRPVSRGKKFSGIGEANQGTEWGLFNAVWEFSISQQ